jgi:transcriptional regulator with GAF, ATPase, and Fis domain
LLLDVWREVCRHIEIGEAAENIAALLVRHMPLELVLVRRLDRQRQCLETVAVGSGTIQRMVAPAAPLPEAKSECSEDQTKPLLAWCRQGTVFCGRRSDAGEPLLATIVPQGVEEEVLAGPLGSPDNPAGVLILAAAPGQHFVPEHRQTLQLLLEPLSVALENDHRLREMAALREAAEAEKQSLLTRLGRKALADTVVGEDSGLHAVMDRVELVARSDVPVLIVGETGTGKELVTRLIHNRSKRQAGPFIRVNCGAIPPELIDSQLFGHERGAFTGAVETRPGWFERADGGTLLLDELGELPLAAQVRLLRILQDGWLERVGGHKPINVDVRIVAATHRDLAAMVTEGQFREDLWYRIAVFPIILPPLRERREDIPALASHFAGRAATRFGLPVVMPTAEDIAMLSGYPWPGNIRELATVIDRAAIIGNGRRLEVAKALGVDTSVPARPDPVDKPATAPPASPAEILPLDAAMAQHIESVLRLTQGRIEGPYGAARLLKINPHTLRARMRKLAIPWRQFRPVSPSGTSTAPGQSEACPR